MFDPFDCTSNKEKQCNRQIPQLQLFYPLLKKL